MCKKKSELFSGWFSSGFPIGLSNEKLQPILFVVGVGRRGFHVAETHVVEVRHLSPELLHP
jgi:hypothetical protein